MGNRLGEVTAFLLFSLPGIQPLPNLWFSFFIPAIFDNAAFPKSSLAFVLKFEMKKAIWKYMQIKFELFLSHMDKIPHVSLFTLKQFLCCCFNFFNFPFWIILD